MGCGNEEDGYTRSHEGDRFEVARHHRELLIDQFNIEESAELVYATPSGLFGEKSSIVLIHDYISTGHLFFLDEEEAWELDISENKSGFVSSYLLSSIDLDNNGFKDYQIVVERNVGSITRFLVTYMKFEEGSDVFF